jgi:hypothetical protein
MSWNNLSFHIFTPHYTHPIKVIIHHLHHSSIDAKASKAKQSSKSHGPDDIPYSFIKNLPSNGQNQLLQIYNLIWESGFYPDSWRNAIIIPIPKPNKNKFNISNFPHKHTKYTSGKNG